MRLLIGEGENGSADILTKPLHRPTFTRLKGELGIYDISGPSEGENVNWSLEPGGVLKGAQYNQLTPADGSVPADE